MQEVGTIPMWSPAGEKNGERKRGRNSPPYKLLSGSGASEPDNSLFRKDRLAIFIKDSLFGQGEYLKHGFSKSFVTGFRFFNFAFRPL